MKPRRPTWFLMLLIILTIIGAITGSTGARSSLPTAPLQNPSEVEFITPDQLKAKLKKGDSLTIIDVRATSSLVDSDSKIKGAIHVKLRRLRARLQFPPLKDVSRNSEVVLYCACPNDEASIHGAEILMAAGFKRVRALKGGWVAWNKGQGPIESRARN